MSGDKLRERYFPDALAELDKLMAHGAETHDHDLSWKDKPVLFHFDHTMEHLRERFTLGLQKDKESKQTILAHIAARALMMLQVECELGRKS